MKGSFHQSRRESNFYNYLKPDKQLAYAKQWVASLNSKLLEPFVKITGATKFNREVFYEIDIERLLKVEEENQRLRRALEHVQSQLFSIRGVNNIHDSEITGLCVEIRQALDGDSDEH